MRICPISSITIQTQRTNTTVTTPQHHNAIHQTTIHQIISTAYNSRNAPVYVLADHISLRPFLLLVRLLDLVYSRRPASHVPGNDQHAIIYMKGLKTARFFQKIRKFYRLASRSLQDTIQPD